MAKTKLYSTAVEKDYTFLDEMRVHASYINEQQIFSHIFMARYKERDVDDLIEDIRCIRLRFQKERREIAEFAESYNTMYATDNNECFSVVWKFCRLLRKTLKGAMEIFRNFCAKKSHKLICRNGKLVRLSVHTHSDLGARYTQMLIPFNEDEAIPPKLRELSNLLIEFFVEITDVVGICKEVMIEEVKILKDYPRLKKIYDDTIEEIQEMGMATLNIIKCPDSIDKIDDPMTREMLQSETDKWNEILAKYFHKRTKGQFLNHLLLYNAFKEKYAFIPTAEEKNLWNDDFDRIKKVRMLIAYVDEFDEAKGQHDRNSNGVKLNGKFLAKLMYWAMRGTDIKKSDFVKYFNKAYDGKYQKIEYATVMAVNLRKEEKEGCVIRFENFLNAKKEDKKIA